MVTAEELPGRLHKITLNNPKRGNSLGSEMSTALRATVEETLRKKPKGVVITADGRFFCIGADPKELKKEETDPQIMVKEVGATFEMLAETDVFLACFVHGDCIGGGMGLPLHCDYTLAKEGARFGLPEAALGLFPFLICPALEKKLGPKYAMDLAFGGQLHGHNAHVADVFFSEWVSEADYDKRCNQLIDLWAGADEQLLHRLKLAFKHPGKVDRQTLYSFVADSIANFRD